MTSWGYFHENLALIKTGWAKTMGEYVNQVMP
jgi:hypothetical protein